MNVCELRRLGAPMKTFFCLAILVLAAVIGYPLLNEETTSPCRALEHRFIGLATAQHTGADSPASAVFATAFADALSGGEIAAALIRHRHPDLPPAIGCTVIYWQAIVDPDVLRPAQQRDPETSSGFQRPDRIQRKSPAATSLDHPADDASQSYGSHRARPVCPSRECPGRIPSRSCAAATSRQNSPRRVDGDDRPSDITADLTAAQRGAIVEYVRRCWSTDPGMLDLDRMQVLLAVSTDARGTIRRASVAPEDQGRVAANLRLRVFAERAIRAVMDPNCANLPLPTMMLGQFHTFTVRFKP